MINCKNFVFTQNNNQSKYDVKKKKKKLLSLNILYKYYIIVNKQLKKNKIKKKSGRQSE